MSIITKSTKKNNVSVLVAILCAIVFLCSGCFSFTDETTVTNATQKNTENEKTVAPDNSDAGFTLTVECEKNLAMAKYDVEINLDGQKVAVLPHGAKQSYQLDLSEGNHSLIVRKAGDESVNGTKTFTLEGSSGSIQCYLVCHTKYIEFKAFELASNDSSAKDNETSTQKEEPMTESSSEEATTAKPSDEAVAGYYVLVYFKSGDEEVDQKTLEAYEAVLGYGAYMILKEDHKGYMNTFGEELDVTWGDGKINKANYIVDGDYLEIRGEDFVYRYQKSNETPPEPGSSKEPETTKVPETTEGNTVSWEYRNALESAKTYSSFLHMSKKGIYDQLISPYGDNFPKDAAQYAIDHLDADYKLNALESAKSYSSTMHMSKKGIYDQLISEYGEQFTAEEAQYAVDHLNVDFKQNALASAKTYRDSMHMSKAEIYNQLVSQYGEQFTAEEAQYAIDHLDD